MVNKVTFHGFWGGRPNRPLPGSGLVSAWPSVYCFLCALQFRIVQSLWSHFPQSECPQISSVFRPQLRCKLTHVKHALVKPSILLAQRYWSAIATTLFPLYQVQISCFWHFLILNPIHNSCSKLVSPVFCQNLFRFLQFFPSPLKEGTLSFIHFHTHYSSREGREVAALGGVEISHSFQQTLIVLLVHTKTGPSKVGGVITPPGPWSTYGSLSRPVGVASRTRQSFLGHSGYVAEPS